MSHNFLSPTPLCHIHGQYHSINAQVVSCYYRRLPRVRKAFHVKKTEAHINNASAYSINANICRPVSETVVPQKAPLLDARYHRSQATQRRDGQKKRHIVLWILPSIGMCFICRHYLEYTGYLNLDTEKYNMGGISFFCFPSVCCVFKLLLSSHRKYRKGMLRGTPL